MPCSYSILTSICLFQDYELQLVAYKAQVEPLTSPLKKTKMESASDNIIQEVSDFSIIVDFVCPLYISIYFTLFLCDFYV